MLSTFLLAEILASNVGKCPEAQDIFQTLKNITVVESSKPSLYLNYQVTGTTPEGDKVKLSLTKGFNCSSGSRGGGGCSTFYQCVMETTQKVEDYNCEAICSPNSQGYVTSAPRFLETVKAQTFSGLETQCQAQFPHAPSVYLFSTTQYQLLARYLSSEKRLYNTPATESDSCQ